MHPPTKLTPTQTAWLPSEGYAPKDLVPVNGHNRRWTLHTFTRYEEVAPESLKYSAEHGPRGIGKALAMIYTCSETGVERRWGLG